MNILIDSLPESVNIGGVEYRINTGFRTSILFELLIKDKSIPDQGKVQGMLRLYYPEIPPDRDEAVKKILWFFNCGKEQKKKKEIRNQTAKDFRENKEVYSFEKDAFLIYSAFKAEYGIDLQDTDDLHWWKFSAMLEGLSDGCKFRKVMSIRGMELSGLSKKEKKRINDLKKLYALEDVNEDVDSRNALAKRNAKMKEYVRRRTEEVKRRVGS